MVVIFLSRAWETQPIQDCTHVFISIKYCIVKNFQRTNFSRFLQILFFLKDTYSQKSQLLSKIALLKYFKRTKLLVTSILSLPSGSLSDVMPSSSIEAANKEVKSIISQEILSQNDAERNSTWNLLSNYSRP